MSYLVPYFVLALIGASGGLSAGLVGLAGGSFIVPALVAVYGAQAMGDAVVVSFFAVLLNSLSTSRANLRARGRETYLALIGGAKWYACGAIGASCLIAILFGRYKDAIPNALIATL